MVALTKKERGVELKRILIAGALACLASPVIAQPERGPLLLEGLFQDHAVLQRDRPIPVWGSALPGEQVTIEFAGSTVRARADRSGRWVATLPASAVGGPYELVVSTPRGANQTIGDIMVGDVWLCSGQSNMEMSVAASRNSWGELNNAADDGIRLLTVGHDTGPLPVQDFKTPVRWQVATRESVGEFSAACYFMARDLRATENVPLGLIEASWGGTAIDAWRSEKAIAKSGTSEELLAVLDAYRRDSAEGNRRWGSIWERWWAGATRSGERPWEPGSLGDWKAVPSLTPWESWGEPSLAAYNGMLWYRTGVDLTPEQAASRASISIGAADEVDTTWVNGVAVGSDYHPGSNRTYEIPAGVLKPGANQIVINVLDTYGAGGLGGAPEQRAISFANGDRVPLTSGWEYRMPPVGIGNPPRAPWETNAGLSSIYNGMIAPLGNFGLKGIAWYQGESDAANAAGYRVKLRSLISDWRKQFESADLPFLVVQLPGWGQRVSTPAESGFAQIREEQRAAVAAESNAGLAVTIDIGDPTDLHPGNKQEVGRRLARAARSLAYGESISPSGPEFAGVQRDGELIAVSFRHVEGGLVTYSAQRPIAFELCGPETGSCRFVEARLEGNRVLIDLGDGPASRIRYCWGDSPLCNLHDSSGLPVGPFEAELR